MKGRKEWRVGRNGGAEKNLGVEKKRAGISGGIGKIKGEGGIEFRKERMGGRKRGIGRN